MTTDAVATVASEPSAASASAADAASSSSSSVATAAGVPAVAVAVDYESDAVLKRATDVQRACIARVRELLSAEDNAVFSERDVFRYVRARKNDAKKAAKMLKKTAAFMREYYPQLVSPDEIEVEARLSKMYVRGRTKDGQPVIYMRPGRDVNDDNDLKFSFLVYTLDKAVRALPADQDALTWVIDFRGFSTRLTGMANLSMSRRTLHLLQNHYPERLGRAILLNPPGVFRFFWRFVSPFIDPVTKAKVMMTSSEKNARQVLDEHFDAEQLEEEYGGSAPSAFDHEQWIAAERADFAQRLAQLGITAEEAAARRAARVLK